MKIWKKILVVNLVITLVIMSFFICVALPWLHVQVERLEYQKYQKTLALRLAYADEYLSDIELSTGIKIKLTVRIEVLTNNVNAPYPQYKNDEDADHLKYVEVYGKTIDNSYILLANGTGSQIRQPMVCSYNGSSYDGDTFGINEYYENKTECPLLLTNPRNGSDAYGRLIRYDIDAYAVGNYGKYVTVGYDDVICYGYLIECIYRGLLYSAVAFAIVWILVFIVWVIAYHVIGFVKWLKR